MRLILVRHGETDGNVEKRYIGRTDVPLNGRGREQAVEIAQGLARVPISQAYRSPSRRAAETAELILQGSTVPVCIDARLAELDFGAWENKTYEEAEAMGRAQIYAWYDDPFRVSPPGGETLAELDARLSSWLEELIERHAEETVLVVSHGGPLQWLWAKWVVEEADRFLALRWPPGGWKVCRYEAGRWTREGGVPK